MSQENVKTERGLYAQFARGDFSALSNLPDGFELVLNYRRRAFRGYRGADARDWLRSWADSFDRLTVEAVEFVDGGDQVVTEMLQRGRPAGSESVVELQAWSVSTYRDGLPLRWELFLSRDEALEAAGLRE